MRAKSFAVMEIVVTSVPVKTELIRWTIECADITGMTPYEVMRLRGVGLVLGTSL